MSGLQAFGVFRVGKCHIGIPIEHLAEVCTVGPLSGLMTAEAYILGAFAFRGSLMPLLDLEALAGTGHYDRPLREAVLIQHGDRQVAVTVDEVVSLHEAHPTHTAAPSRQDAGEDGAGSLAGSGLFPEGFVMDGKIVICLDVPAVLARDKVMSVPKPERRKNAASRAAADTFLVLRAGGATIAVDTQHVWATVPKRGLSKLDLAADDGGFLGFIEHIGWRIPVVDTNAILGIGQVAAPRETEVVVLRLSDDRLVGLHVDATERLTAFAAEDQRESSGLIARRGLLPKVVVGKDKTQTFILDHAVFAARSDLIALSKFTDRIKAQKLQASQSTNAAAETNEERISYLVFEAGGTKAVPADQVLQILKAPDRLISAADLPAGVCGFFAVDTHSVPLVALSAQDGVTLPAFVLLIAQEEERIGFLASRIRGIRVSEMRFPAKGTQSGEPDLIQIRESGEKKLIPVIDLHARAAALLVAQDEPDLLPQAG